MAAQNRLEWARAFVLQAKLDLDLACALLTITRGAEPGGQLASRPELCLPAMFGYCQQSIEKALKAWLWYSTGSIPRSHNPLGSVLKAAHMHMRGKSRPRHLQIIDRNRKSVDRILNMAPGATCEDADMAALLSQPNTEYPFRVLPGGRIRLPHEEISLGDVSAAIKVATPLVLSIHGYLGAVGLLGSQ